MHQLVCRCGHGADFDTFTVSPSGAPLGRDEYQCPRCYRAWTFEVVQEGWTTPEGLYVPPRRRVIAIPPRQ